MRVILLIEKAVEFQLCYSLGIFILGDKVIGFLNIRSLRKRIWKNDEINLVKSVETVWQYPQKMHACLKKPPAESNVNVPYRR